MRDVILLIAGAVIGLIVERVVNVTSQFYYRTRPGRRLWALDDHLPTTIVFTGSHLTDESESVQGLAYPSEARAASEVESYLHRLYPDMRFTCRVSSASARPDHGNVVLVGGPLHASNTMTREMIGSAESPYWTTSHFVGHDLHIADLVLSGEPPTASSATDVGLVLSVPREGGGRMVVLAGSYTLGCLAAARSMVRGDASATLRFVGRVTGSRWWNPLPPFALAVKASTSAHDVVGRPRHVVAVHAARVDSTEPPRPDPACPGPQACVRLSP